MASFPSHEIDHEQFAKDVSYSPVDLDSAMIQQAALSAHYGIKAAAAMRQAGIAKLKLQTTEAKIYKDIRNKAAEEGKKMTEAQISAEVDVHPLVIAAKKELNDANYYAELGRAANESFRQRRDMLVQLNKGQLEEQNNLRQFGQGSLDAAKDAARKTINDGAAGSC